MAVTPADIAVAFGRRSPDVGSADDQQWSMWIADARWIISTGDGSHEGLGDLALLDQTTLDFVVREAVCAQIRALEAAAEAARNGEQSAVFRTGRTVRITPAWWGMLDPDLVDSGAFTVTPFYEADTASSGIPDVLSTEWMQGGGLLL